MARVLLILSMLALAAMLLVHHLAGRRERNEVPPPAAEEPRLITVLSGDSGGLHVLVRERFAVPERRALAEPVLGRGRIDLVIENHGPEAQTVSLQGARIVSGGREARLVPALAGEAPFGALLEGRLEEPLAPGHQRALSCVTDPPLTLEPGATGSIAGVLLVARSATRRALDDAAPNSIEVLLRESAVNR